MRTKLGRAYQAATHTDAWLYVAALVATVAVALLVKTGALAAVLSHLGL